MKRKLRILLMAYCFPPMNSIGSHRPHGWARSWRDLGHEIHVLTPAKLGFDGPMDLDLDCTGIEVHEVDYLAALRGAPRPRPDRDATGAKRWEQLKTATRRARFSMAMFGDPRLLAYFALVRSGTRIIASRGIDFIVATSPPEVSLFAARALSQRTGVPWVADFRDLWFRDMRLYHSGVASWLAGLVHRWLLRNAAALVTVSMGQRKRLADYLGREVLNSYNGFLADAWRPTPPPKPWADSRVHIVYTGRIYPGNQDPEPLFRALDALRRENDGLARKVAVDFYGFEDPWLRELVARHRLEDCVRLHGFVPHRESLAVQRAADALLFLDWVNARGEGVLAGKLFEYIGSGRPILSLGRRDAAEAAALLAETRCGVTLTTDEEVAAYLKRLVASAPLPDVASPARERLSREEQARAILDELQARLFRV